MKALLVGFGFASSSIFAASLDGRWVFERSADYFERKPIDLVPRFGTLDVHGNEIKLAEGCVVHFESQDYFFPEVFQPLTKADVTEKQIDNFLLKKFNLSLSKTKKINALSGAPRNCARPVMEFFVIGDRIVMPVGASFYSYVRVEPGVPALSSAAATMPLLSGYTLSRLPMNFDRYHSWCRPKILDRKGHPTTSDKCSPDFFPYVADQKRGDALMNIVGNHDYAFKGQEYTEGFSPPFKQKVAATFLVFPPMKRVALVRVDDFDIVRNEERDVMTGVYLSIVDGKVVDQIEGCHFDQNYVCRVEGLPVARLAQDGKFEPMNSK